MVAVPYEYRGLMAESWDLLRGDPSGRHDRDFYLDVIKQSGEPVLEIGCGTGRLLLDFLSAGIDIDGVDLSPEMLAICYRKGKECSVAPRLYQQAIQELALPRQYRTIIASSSVLQLIPDPCEIRRAMAALNEHLVTGGRMVAPFMTLWRAGMPLQREWEHGAVRANDGAYLSRMGRVWYDPKTECEDTEDLYQVERDGNILQSEYHRRSPAARSYTQAQARRLFEDAHLPNYRLLGGFSWGAADADDWLFTVLATKE